MSNQVLPCPNAKRCGACQLQNLSYPEQLRMKQARLIRLLGRYGRVEEIIGMEEPFRYRNKVQAAFRSRSGAVVSGLYQSSSGKIVDVEDCLLEDEAAAPILKTLRRLCASMKVRPYDIPSGRGFLRHVLIRRARTTGQIMVVLVTARGEFREARPLVNELIRRHPEITTVLWNQNATDTPLFLGPSSTVLYGDGFITDRLCRLEFRISPRSFYQVNSRQAEVLYGIARELAALTGRETVLDAYCGTGTIGLSMAREARAVIGVEVNGDAVADAMDNARRNGIENAAFFAADAGEFMRALATDPEAQKPDVVVTDPPRAGCSQAFLKSLLSLAPERVVYVSCNPETLARDLYILVKGGYRVRRIRPVDMFPWTAHTETVVLLTRKDPSLHDESSAMSCGERSAGERSAGERSAGERSGGNLCKYRSWRGIGARPVKRWTYPSFLREIHRLISQIAHGFLTNQPDRQYARLQRLLLFLPQLQEVLRAFSASLALCAVPAQEMIAHFPKAKADRTPNMGAVGFRSFGRRGGR